MGAFFRNNRIKIAKSVPCFKKYSLQKKLIFNVNMSINSFRIIKHGKLKNGKHFVPCFNTQKRLN